MPSRRVERLLPALFLVMTVCAGAETAPAPGLHETGALVVVLGGDDPARLVDLHRKGCVVVQALHADPEAVAALRAQIEKAGVSGRVSARHYDGRNLPYMDSLVNVIRVEAALQDAGPEILRVLAPRGRAVVRKAGNEKWLSSVGLPLADLAGGYAVFDRPLPSDIDGEWGHWLHGPDNNPVAKDAVVDVPRHLRWIQGPTWVSSHNLNPAVSAMVASNGRLFTLMNEMPPGIGGMPDRWMMTARDAFNGLVLWRRPIQDWGWTHWAEKEYSVEMRFVPPFQIMRRMVAAGDRLFVTPGFTSPVHVLDAATGTTRSILAGTERTAEILHVDGTLYLALNASLDTPKTIPEVRIAAVDPGTGKTLWERAGLRGVSAKLNRFFRHANVLLTAGDGILILLDRDHLVGLDRKTGDERWRAERPEKPTALTDADIESLAEGKTRSANVPNYRADQYFPNNCTMVHSDGVVVLSQVRNTAANHKTRLKKTLLTAAYDAATGRELWRFEGVTFAHFVPPDLFVVDGLVWTLDDADQSYAGLDLRTGAKRKAWPMKQLIWEPRAHQLCFRNKATAGKILFGRTKGSEFIDLRTGETSTHGWIKGMCNIGVLPANGMVYYTPHNCSCRMPSKLTGFRGQSAAGYTGKAGGERLVRGPAFDTPLRDAPAEAGADWPMYRHDPERTGGLPAPLPGKPALKWKTGLRAPLAQVVAVGERLYVAEKDAHRIRCLDRGTGKPVWAFTADGRIDSAPTWSRGRLVFGCRDGHVYCLESETGVLAWRFRAAPDDALIIGHGQLESAWPVHGSLPVVKDIVYGVAGRSTHLNGGMTLFLLDLASGKAVGEAHLQGDRSSPYESEKSVLSDLMTTRDGTVYMRTLRFAAGQAQELAYGNAGKHHFRITEADVVSAAGGMLDTSLFNASAWGVGAMQGQIVAHDGRQAFGVAGHSKYGQSCGHDVFAPAKDGYQLTCRGLADKGGSASGKGTKGKNREKREKPAASKGGWSVRIPIRAIGLLVASDSLYVAGTRDLVEKDDPWAHVEGRRGGVLAVFSISDGRKLGEIALESAPVFDGLSASRKAVYLVTRDGSVLCYE